jgi:co-chaperonin GroES (HSP10)
MCIFVKNKKKMKNLSEKHVLPTKILLKLKEEENRFTPSGLLIPDTAAKVTSCGTAVIVGEGVPSLKVSIKVGQSIMFPPHAGMRVRFEDEDFILINFADVLLYY